MGGGSNVDPRLLWYVKAVKALLPATRSVAGQGGLQLAPPRIPRSLTQGRLCCGAREAKQNPALYIPFIPLLNLPLLLLLCYFPALVTVAA